MTGTVHTINLGCSESQSRLTRTAILTNPVDELSTITLPFTILPNHLLGRNEEGADLLPKL